MSHLVFAKRRFRDGRLARLPYPRQQSPLLVRLERLVVLRHIHREPEILLVARQESPL